LRLHRATLIQDITEYRSIVLALLRPVLLNFASYGYDEEDALEWIVKEEIERIYHLFDGNHIHNHWPLSAIHNHVAASSPILFSKYAEFYLRAPKLYGDNNQVLIELVDQDLWIDYAVDWSTCEWQPYKPSI
jgi:hypothetical protein